MTGYLFFVSSGKCVKFHKGPAPLPASDSFHKQSTQNRRYGGTATPTTKPLRERIIHLLALKAYRKPELLLWMEREWASPRDKAELGGILEEVRRDTHKHAVDAVAHENMFVVGSASGLFTCNKPGAPQEIFQNLWVADQTTKQPYLTLGNYIKLLWFM